MKKLIALFAVLAASSLAQAQGLAGHPDARNDRMLSMHAVVHGPAYRHAVRHPVRHYPKRHHRHHHG